MFKVQFPGLDIGPFWIYDEFSVFGLFNLRFYSTIIALGMVLSVLYALWRFKANGLKMDTVLDYAVWAIPIGIVGARLYFVIFHMIEEPDMYFGGSFWDFWYNVVAVWEGGLAIYGGIIVGGFVIMAVALKKKTNPLKIIDIVAPAVMFAQCLGRWGNFFNFEAFGEANEGKFRMCLVDYNKDSYFASHSYNEYVSALEAKGYDPASTVAGVHPTFLYESLWNLLGTIIMITTLIVAVYILKVAKERRIEGFFFSFYMIWYGSGRMVIEGLRTDSLWLIPGVIRVSQLVALITLVIGVLLMAFLITRKVLQLKKNIDIWQMFKDKIKSKKEAKNGTDN